MATVAPVGVLVIPLVLLVLLGRLLRQRGTAAIWAARGLMLWVALRFATVELGAPGLHGVVHALGTLAMVGLTVTLVQRVVAPGRVDIERLHVAVSAYLAAGFAFGNAYLLLELLQPGSFGDLPAHTLHKGHTLVYFSFTTLTTVGYGDIAPATPAARALAAAEGIGGQLYLAVLVGRLIGLHLSDRGAAPPPG